MNNNFQMNHMLLTQNCNSNQVNSKLYSNESHAINNQYNQNFQYPIFNQASNISNNLTVNRSVILPVNKPKAQNSLSKPIEIPKQFNDKLIRKLMRDKRFSFNQFETIKKTQSYYEKQLKRTRIPFTKEEDEKIRQLVNRFGSGHWELISHFMERRTAKQCRDRYTNYLVPCVFQGEWMKEEDELLTQLYNTIGPKWSILQKYIPYRSSTNIKNRWHYFLSKQVQNNTQNGIIVSTQIIPENQTEMKGDEIQTNTIILNDNSNNNPIVQNQNQLNENVQLISQNPENEQEDDNIETKNNNTATTNNTMFEMENEWMIFN